MAVYVCLVFLALMIATLACGQHVARKFTYKQTPQGSLELFVDYPADWKPTDTRPGIVFFFGGAWTDGSVEQFSRQATYLAGRGLVAIRADYRTASKHHTEPDAATEDGRSALRWVRAHAHELGIDPNRLVAAGGSSGGHLAACTAQCPLAAAEGEDSRISPRPNALVLFNPGVDITIVPQLPSPYSDVFHTFPRLGQDESFQQRISPTYHVMRGDPPALLLFGKNDPLLASARPYIDKMVAVGTRAELYTAAGEDHGFFNHPGWYQRTLYRVDEFLASLGYVNGAPTITIPRL